MAADLDALLGGESDDAEETSSSLDAAQDLLNAITAKDAKAIDLALKRHYELCQSEHAEDEDDDYEESPEED